MIFFVPNLIFQSRRPDISPRDQYLIKRKDLKHFLYNQSLKPKLSLTASQLFNVQMLRRHGLK